MTPPERLSSELLDPLAGGTVAFNLPARGSSSWGHPVLASFRSGITPPHRNHGPPPSSRTRGTGAAL
jgi:hypothetical protein